MVQLKKAAQDIQVGDIARFDVALFTVRQRRADIPEVPVTPFRPSNLTAFVARIARTPDGRLVFTSIGEQVIHISRPYRPSTQLVVF